MIDRFVVHDSLEVQKKKIRYFYIPNLNQRLKSQSILNKNIEKKLIKKYFLSKSHFTRN